MLTLREKWHVAALDAQLAVERAQCWRGYARVKQTLQRAQKIFAALKT